MLSPHPFTATSELRLAWARQRYFDDGLRPTGLVSEAVIQSWARCLARRQQPQQTPLFNTVSRSRLHSVLGAHRGLLQAAAGELAALQQTLARTPVVGLLMDPRGVVMHCTRQPDAHQAPILARAARVGVCLGEAQVGTTAPGITACTGQACVVSGAEHFAQAIVPMHCAAAPVLDSQGRLMAVLNLSSEGQPFGFDAAGVVALCATAIENQWLLAQASEPLVMQLQVDRSLLPTPLAGLMAVDAHGRVAWLNRAAVSLLGGSASSLVSQPVEAVLGLGVDRLHALIAPGVPLTLRLPTGLALWVSGDCARPLPAQPPADAPAPAVDPEAVAPALPPAAPDAPVAAPSLRAHGRALIDSTLAACQGNVSLAARQLGVSRGVIYRHLQSVGGHDGRDD